MHPTEKWLAHWNLLCTNTYCPPRFGEYFTESVMAGRRLTVIDIGSCTLPTGRVLVRDPICQLEDRAQQPYFHTVPPGAYRTELCVVLPDKEEGCARYAALRLRFSQSPTVRFEEAMLGSEALDELDRLGFRADAGLACICDAQVHGAYCAFVEQWRQEHPGKNLYDDYFRPLFADSFVAQPQYQRHSGDWLNWQVPGSEYRMPIVQSGFGDGRRYHVYFGFDALGEICQLLVCFIDIMLEFDHAGRHLTTAQFFPVQGGLRGQIALEKWHGLFQRPGPYSLVLAGAGGTLTPMQRNGYDFLLRDQREIYSTILTVLMERYPTVGYHHVLTREDAPVSPLTAATLAARLTLLEIIFHPVEYGGLPYIGYHFACPWDTARGFGVLLHGYRVVAAGQGAVACTPQLASRDLAACHNRGGKEELLTLIRADRWEERNENSYMTTSYRGQEVFFYLENCDDTRLRIQEQKNLNRLLSCLRDLDQQAREVLLHACPGQSGTEYLMNQVVVYSDGAFHLGFHDTARKEDSEPDIWVEFSWDFQPTGAVHYSNAC